MLQKRKKDWPAGKKNCASMHVSRRKFGQKRLSAGSVCCKKEARVPEAIISLAYSPVAHCLRCRSGIIISRCLQYICAVIKRVGRPHTVAIMLHDSSLIYTFSAKVGSRYSNHFVMAGAYGRLVHMVYILNHHRPYQV